MAQADMFGVCAGMTTQPGRRDEVVDLIREFVWRGLGDESGLSIRRNGVVAYSRRPSPPCGRVLGLCPLEEGAAEMFGTMYGPVPRLPSATSRHPRPAGGTARTTRDPAVVWPDYDLDRERHVVMRDLLLLMAAFILILVVVLTYKAW